VTRRQRRGESIIQAWVPVGLLVLSSIQNICIDFVEDGAEIRDEYELDILVYSVVDSSIIYYSVEYLLFLSFFIASAVNSFIVQIGVI
jgi:hypothetical protein